ncbi:MAG TPA: hypothetical protein VMU22_15965 [Rhizomicrobium sp.]|nr:hypothetical protein [Rhizomicrobium sp.]
MRLNLHFAAALAWTLWQVIPASANDVRPITKIESRELPPDVVTQRVLSQLANILHLEKYTADPGHRPHLPLNDLWLWTSPRATYAPELCAADQVTVYFRPVAEISGPETKTVAEGIHAKTYYRFLHLPVLPMFSAMGLSDVRDLRARCADVNPEKEQMLSARDEESAVEGVWLISELASELKSTPPSFTLDCHDYRDDDPQCLSDAKLMRPEEVTNIESCESDDGRATCWEIDQFGFHGHDIGVRLYVETKNGKPNIVRVHPIEWVTTADARAD